MHAASGPCGPSRGGKKALFPSPPWLAPKPPHLSQARAEAGERVLVGKDAAADGAALVGRRRGDERQQLGVGAARLRRAALAQQRLLF